MNYKEIFCEGAVAQFKKEGATFVLCSLFNNKDLIRDIEVRLEDPHKVFSIAARNTAAEAAMAKNFCGSVIDGEKWYPFETGYIMSDYQPQKVLKEVADTIKTDITDLKWAFVTDQST